MFSETQARFRTMKLDRNAASPGMPIADPNGGQTSHRKSDYRAAPNRVRRMLVGGTLVALSVVPLVGVIHVARAAAGDTSRPAVRNAFMQVSRFLCGTQTLEDTQADHLLDALLAGDTGFGTACTQLAAFIAEKQPDPLELQSQLDTDKVPFAALPARIVTAWFVGVVGSGRDAKCITYVTSLMNRAVEDRLRPPSYAYGAYATWNVDPQTVQLKPLVAPLKPVTPAA
jgi:hypothetical protein